MSIKGPPGVTEVGGRPRRWRALRRRRRPSSLAVVVGFGTQLMLTLTSSRVHLDAGPVTVAWFCALYALAVWTTNRWFVVALAFVVLANGGTDLLHPSTSPGAALGIGAAIVMGLVRLARELHDVIGHHVSRMVVQAGAERRMLPQDQTEAREVLGTIERVGRSALDEMRRTSR